MKILYMNSNLYKKQDNLITDRAHKHVYDANSPCILL